MFFLHERIIGVSLYPIICDTLFNICIRMVEEMSKNGKPRIKWSIPAPILLDEALEKAVRLDTHSTKSDFVRDAVRRRLEEMGFRPQIFKEKETP